MGDERKSGNEICQTPSSPPLATPPPSMPYDLWHHLDNKLCGLSPLLPRLLLLMPTPMWIKQMLQLLFLATASPPTLPHYTSFAPYFLVVSTKCCFISLWRYLRSGVLCRVALGSCRSRANKLKLTPALPVPLSWPRSLLPYIFLQY